MLVAKRWGWMVAGGAAGCGAVIGWHSMRSEPLPIVQLAEGTTSRVLKVSYGTNHVFVAEPFWKQALRKALPQRMQTPLGPAKRYESSTPYDSLAVFVKTDPIGARMIEVQTVFPDGTTFDAGWLPSWTPITCFVFRSYAREEKEVRLQFVENKRGSVEVSVPNPRRARRASWTGKPLPLTNYSSGAEIVFGYWWSQGTYDAFNLMFRARPLNGPRVGNMHWRTTLFDPWGNWADEDTGVQRALPGAKSNKEFRVLAKGHEDISAEAVTIPTNQQYFVLPLKERATNWGVQLFAFLGPGCYEVSKEFAIQNSKPGSMPKNGVRWSGQSWVVQCAEPALLTVASRPVERARCREWLGDKIGRLFYGYAAGSATDRGLTAQLFNPRLPPVTTNLYAHVEVRWPTVEFFVEKPEGQALRTPPPMEFYR